MNKTNYEFQELGDILAKESDLKFVTVKKIINQEFEQLGIKKSSTTPPCEKNEKVVVVVVHSKYSPFPSQHISFQLQIHQPQIMPKDYDNTSTIMPQLRKSVISMLPWGPFLQAAKKGCLAACICA